MDLSSEISCEEKKLQEFLKSLKMARILGQVQTQLINYFILYVGLINAVFSLLNYSQITNGKWEIM